MKKEVQDALKALDKNEIQEIVQDKKSLKFYRTLKSKERAFYIANLGKQERGATAWAKLGGWVWQGRKDGDGGRKCPLCGNLDGINHIMVECRELQREREILQRAGIWVEIWNMKHCFMIRDRRVAEALGKFLTEVRGKRNKAVEKDP